jgi:hypothetical protein
MADNKTDTPADGYYGDDNANVEELDLSFLDDDETKETDGDTKTGEDDGKKPA